MWRVAIAALILGCGGKSDGDSGLVEEADTDTDTDADTTAVVTTVSADYSSGALATIDLSDWTVTDEITVLGTDTVVSAGDDYVYVMARSSADYVRVYEPGSWDEPLVEIGLAAGANAQDAELCDDKLFVSLYGVNYMGIYDLDTGTLSGTVDLSPYEESIDGTPESYSMVELDGQIYVALQQLRNWSPAGGMVAQIDCASGTVVADWEVGDNPSITALDETRLLVNTGAYGDSSTGGLAVLDTAKGSLSDVLVSEDSVGRDLNDVAVVGDSALVAASNTDYSGYSLYCLDLTSWTMSLAADLSSYVPGLAASSSGHVLVPAQAATWLDPKSSSGIMVWDPATCTELTDGDWISTALNPNSIAFY